MLKKLLIIFALFTVNIAYAGSYENALEKNDKVFLYLYSPVCGTCSMFNKIYNNLKLSNPEFAYVKVNAETPYGSRLMMKFRARYVPYIILTNSKTGKSVNVNHSCVMDDVCLIRAMKSFKG